MNTYVDNVDFSGNRGTLINSMAGNLLQRRSLTELDAASDKLSLPANNVWLQQSFMTTLDRGSESMLSRVDRLNEMFSSATMKYTNSSIGGNIPINPPPQFTRYADIRDPGLHTQNSSFFPTEIGSIPQHVSVKMPLANALSSAYVDYGMGRHYSEAIDDNSQIIHLRFGVATYNSLLQFFTGFYSSGMATAARTARFSDSWFDQITTLFGKAVGFALLPLFMVPMALAFAGRATQFMLGLPSTKFYYLKPAMPMYWTAVGTIVNQLCALQGITNTFSTKQSRALGNRNTGFAAPPGEDNSIQNLLSKYLPDGILDESGLIDVRNIASRSKRLEMRFNETLSELFQNSSPGTQYEEIIRMAYERERKKGKAEFPEPFKSPETYVLSWMDAWRGTSKSEGMETDVRAKMNTSDASDEQGNRKIENVQLEDYDKNKPSWFDKMVGFFVAEAADGSDWVSFRVDNTGSVQESFDNSTTPSSLAGKINSMSASNRDIRINLADGNLAPGLGTIVEGLTNVISGAASVLHVDGIAALAGSAFVDIPDNWENSVASLPKSDYTISLAPVYGNPISQMLYMYIPLACLLAGALPLATGAQSYTSPFLCQLHDKGRNFVRLGIIDRMSITRGTTNTAFNNNGRPMGIDVTFSVKDLSSVMAAPITTQGFSPIDSLLSVFDDQNTFMDYMMTLSGMPLADTIYQYSMAKYRAQEAYNNLRSSFSASNMASQLVRFVPGVGIANAIFRGTNR